MGDARPGAVPSLLLAVLSPPPGFDFGAIHTPHGAAAVTELPPGPERAGTQQILPWGIWGQAGQAGMDRRGWTERDGQTGMGWTDRNGMDRQGQTGRDGQTGVQWVVTAVPPRISLSALTSSQVLLGMFLELENIQRFVLLGVKSFVCHQSRQE